MRRFFAILSILILLADLTGCASSTPSAQFEEIGNYFHNHTSYKIIPTGPITRIKSVYVLNFKNDPQVWIDIQNYAKKTDWAEGDFNVIFFYNDENNTPGNEITSAADDNSALTSLEQHTKYCVANYYHYATGEELFTKYPFH
jgi:hypothetical protein